MPFDFSDVIEFIGELLTLDFSKCSSWNSEDKNKYSKKIDYTKEIWSGSFLVVASILCILVF